MGNQQQFKLLRKDDKIFKSITKLLIDLPCPLKISYFWNFGSLLGVTLGFQIITGLILSMCYVSEIRNAFSSVDMIKREINKGWVIRYFHIRGASLFFIFLYFHIARGIYFFSFKLLKTWTIGVIIFLCAMATAFLGYILPWGQMSYWGATVITKFFSVVPYIGTLLVEWIWGGFAVDYPTLTRFFSLHFLVPFVLLFFVILHLIFLHERGSKNPLGVSSKKDKIYFFPFFFLKDTFGFFTIFFLFFVFFFRPRRFFEFQKFLEANPLVTPTHIQPEWYFLPAYAVLRAIPKKLGGVLALVSFIFILFFIPFIYYLNKKFSVSLRKCRFKLGFQIRFWFWIFKFFFLVWIGACPVEYPFLELSRFCSFFYFCFFLLFYFF
jgi:ubiquinol-cytochrome c reductase cytochrome b subunit